MISITLETLSAREQLKLLAMPEKKRERLVWRAARELEKIAKANIANQQDWNGKPWTPRKSGRRRMLVGLRKYIKINQPSADTAEIHFQGGQYGVHPGILAGVHQRGHVYKVTAASRAHIKPKNAGTDTPATKAQARRLRMLGFKRPGKRKGQYRSASLGWITENINYAQAGLLIKKLQDEPIKQSWEIKLPARPFLGANAQQREKAFARALQGIDYGWDVNKQDMKKK